ncbi:hypothetical protein L6164_001994 [Bauhinia variegata]|uniref:Uncharacterized protein n=1 Tax=Bauhinia variegata TaxID=167791 RepID=A0ACB9PWU2_BAUVA|nr:hypothetical protein L6164_001994 [Bauhinia variegata]
MNIPHKKRTLFSLFVLSILVLPTQVSAKCKCDEEDEDRDRTQALKFKIVAIASIAVASAIVGLWLCALPREPVDAFATMYFNESHVNKGQDEVPSEEGRLPIHTHTSHGHALGSDVLELGIVVHSVIIGISLGASESPKAIKPLIAALTFHQFFEGMGLSSCMTRAKFKSIVVIMMALFFSLTTPAGIAIVLGISNVYDKNSPTALVVEGILNAASAGILIYMALVDLLAADFMNPRMQNSIMLQMLANVSLLLGAGLASLLAKWA